MKIIAFPIFLLVSLIFTQAKNKGQEWISLFDGKTTQGWTPRNEVESFKAEEGELRLLSKVNVWILSDIKMKDFEVQCEVKIPNDYKNFNSGLGFRLIGETKKPKGYQFEIDRSKPGGVYGIGMGGWLYPRSGKESEYAKRSDGLFKPLEWNHARVLCKGPHIKTYLNHKLIADFKDTQAIEGHFGIQHHGKGGVVAFRNIKAQIIN